MITSSPGARTTAPGRAPQLAATPFQLSRRLPQPALVLRGPGCERAVHRLPYGWSRIGRSPTAEIRLEHSEVSRTHARLIRDRDESLHIIDARSLNGLFLNGDRVRWAELYDGDELVIGPYTATVLTRARAEHAHT